MIRWPWVSARAFDVVDEQLRLERARADRLSARVDRLFEMFIRLKQRNYEVAAAGRVTAPPDPEQQALRAVEQQFVARARANDREFIDSAVQQLVAEGLPLAAAKAEAARLRAEVTDMHPAGG